MQRVRIHNTFIDVVEEEEAAPGSPVRNASAPPRMNSSPNSHAEGPTDASTLRMPLADITNKYAAASTSGAATSSSGAAASSSGVPTISRARSRSRSRSRSAVNQRRRVETHRQSWADLTDLEHGTNTWEPEPEPEEGVTLRI